MANEILYQCSNCGKREQTRAALGVPDGMFYAGYRAHGDVLYCPDCVKTWKERNGAEYDEQYKDPPHLFAMWWNRQVQTQITDKASIKTYCRNFPHTYCRRCHCHRGSIRQFSLHNYINIFAAFREHGSAPRLLCVIMGVTGGETYGKR